MAEQNSYYDEQILQLTERISTGRNTSAAHKKQLDKIREYIRAVRETDELDIDNTELYRDLVIKIVVYESKDERILEYYLNCVPFGFRVKYHMHRDTLLLCVEEANKKEFAILQEEKIRQEREQARKNQHYQNVNNVIGNIKF